MEVPTLLFVDDRPQLLEIRKALLESHAMTISSKWASEAQACMQDTTSPSDCMIDCLHLKSKQRQIFSQ